MTAVGKYTSAPLPDHVIVESNMTLVFDTGGGPVSGEGRYRTEKPNERCTRWIDSTYHYTGNYYPEFNTFSGTWQEEWVDMGFNWSVKTGCKELLTSGTRSGEWSASLEDGVVTSTGGTRSFQLTVQGQ